MLQQTSTSVQSPDFVAFIGIDWADKAHAICLQANGESRVKHQKVEHSPEALNKWVGELHQRFGDGPIAVCLEQSKGSLINFLICHDLFVLYPINPKTLAKFREAFRPSGAKDDPNDAENLLDIIVSHRDKLTPWKPDDEVTRKINILARKRRDAVNQRTAFSNQQKAALKVYFPQALDLIGKDLSTPMSCDFLLKWPTLETIKSARRKTIEQFYKSHNCFKADLINDRLQIIRQAEPLTSDPAILATYPLEVTMLGKLLKQLTKSIAEYDRQLKALYPQHADAEIFSSFPGAGPVHSARLAAAFGTDRTRYKAAEDIQTSSGVAPIKVASGNTCRIAARYRCPKYDRQSFVEYAGQSINHSIWAGAYYAMQRQNNKRHNVIIRALAFKWMRIMYRCWQDKKNYDELLYLKSLQKKGAELLKYIPAAATG